jgi:ATP-binding cassette subfamily C protein CydD
MFWQDLASGITVIIVLPLIPVFMILIGQATQSVQRAQWDSLQRLSTGFLDLVGGLGTLKIYGRAARQSTRLTDITEDYRSRTMKVLRISFLSGFALELAASLSVALVAVSIGLRLVDGSMVLGVGLFILLLAPEAFLPIRQVGVQFHAAADGLAAAEDVFGILDEAERPGTESVPSPARATATSGVLELEQVTISRGERPIVSRFSGRFLPGTLTVISGPSGVGKSTLVAALQGFIPWTGSISLGGTPLRPGGTREWLAWAGQRPGLFSGTIAENLAIGDNDVSPEIVRLALLRAGASELDPNTVLGVQGQGLSGGQAQRVAVARALYRAHTRDCRVLVLDEPSSALDTDAENALIAGLREEAAEGRIVIVVSHRPAFSAAADHTIVLRESAHV